MIKRGVLFSVLAAVVFCTAYLSIRVVHARSVVVDKFNTILTKDELAISAVSIEHQQWLLMIEDPGFYDHNGIDLQTPGAVITTITQSLVKQLFFDKFKPGWRKLDQSLIAWLAVTPKISKTDHLAALFEIAYLGRCDGGQVYGFEAAASCYYQGTLATLNDDQYLSLVTMLIGPNHFHPVNNPARHKDRLTRVTKVVKGECQAQGNGDVLFKACAG